MIKRKVLVRTRGNSHKVGTTFYLDGTFHIDTHDINISNRWEVRDGNKLYMNHLCHPLSSHYENFSRIDMDDEWQTEYKAVMRALEKEKV